MQDDKYVDLKPEIKPDYTRKPTGILIHGYSSFWEWLIGQKSYIYKPIPMNTFKFELGTKIKDKLTGVSGTIVGQYRTASIVRYEIAYANNAGSMIQDWIDEERIEIV